MNIVFDITLERRIFMESVKKNKIIKLIYLTLICLISIFLVSIVFPTYSIFGYTHELTGSELAITITPMPLFNVLMDDFYSPLLKVGYCFLFAFEILTLISCLLLIIFSILRKKKIIDILSIISACSLIVLQTLIIAFFYDNPLVLTISIISLVLTILITLFNFKFRKEETYVNQ